LRLKVQDWQKMISLRRHGIISIREGVIGGRMKS